MNPALAMTVTTLALAGLAIRHVNHRLDLLNVRGNHQLEWFGIGLLIVFGLIVVGLGRLRNDSRVAYLLSPMTAAVVILAYFVGTARLD